MQNDFGLGRTERPIFLERIPLQGYHAHAHNSNAATLQGYRIEGLAV